ncbi:MULTISPECIES: FAD-dependent oxidoreductase [unclassified Actinobaculum]|uniref:protoporphyrinogen/coproporphyrinogen oxidase n=1 Tax=unclassified Actinobaculum TaxID=2609299 RepID=UPI000D526EB4|nr:MULTISPECIES: FAD-dependent oxidoreductase [unclassified Actinobaculum]AWE41730.1 hypothetical protein DDD63_01960 [Actinobaculum sp. 313]RTE50358.1 FAD-dependent oxidoreductase [Actinobaculum sp. 352]
MKAVVIGAGIAGLACAHRLVREGWSVDVLEATDRPGGLIAPLEIAGQVIDRGAEAYARRRGIGDRLCAELGLDVAAPAGRAHIRWSTTESWPGADGILGIPASPDDPALLRALRPVELAVARAEPQMAPSVGQDAETVGELVAARMGKAVVDRLVAPVTRSIYRLAPEQMTLAQYAPALRGPGSLYAKVQAARGSRSSVAQPIGGLVRLVDALVEDIRARGGQVHLCSRVAGISPRKGGSSSVPTRGAQHCPAAPQREGASSGRKAMGSDEIASGREAPARLRVSAVPNTNAGWHVKVGNTDYMADRVVLACPGRVAVALLRGIGVTAAAPATSSSLSVVLAVDPTYIGGAPVGSGVLLAHPIEGLRARALTHYSVKWPWSAGQSELIRLSYSPQDEPTEQQAVEDAAVLLGCPIPAARDMAVVRWPEIPRGLSPDARAVLDASLPEGVRVAGAWVAGNGVEAAIASGLEAAV